MEFFRIVKVKTTEDHIHHSLNLNSVEKMSSQIFQLDEVKDDEVKIGSVWGEFTLTRNIIRGGLRFGLKECPNALAWTITTGFDPDPQALVIHMTVNRTQIKPELLEELEEFIADLDVSLQSTFVNKKIIMSG